MVEMKATISLFYVKSGPLNALFPFFGSVISFSDNLNKEIYWWRKPGKIERIFFRRAFKMSVVTR